MSIFNLKFKSIKVERVEKIDPASSQTKFIMGFISESVESHELNFNIKDIIIDKAWVINFFLAAMIASALFALIYGGMVLGGGIDFSNSGNITVKMVYFLTFVVFFLLVWIIFSVKGAVNNKKNVFVEDKRGKANWKIVDEDKWDKFSRLLDIAKDE